MRRASALALSLAIFTVGFGLGWWVRVGAVEPPRTPTTVVFSEDVPPHREPKVPEGLAPRTSSHDWSFWEPRIIRCESGGNPTGQNRHSTASGLFAILKKTWAGHGGYAIAREAPIPVQREKAWLLYDSWRARGGTGLEPWAESLRCIRFR